MQGERCWYRNIGLGVMRNLLEEKVIIPMNHFKRTEMLLTLPEVDEDSLEKMVTVDVRNNQAHRPVLLASL